ncbi:NAD(P)/FAD-dependent oxidoreductase [Aestuariimicrobium ganziense]|uniref:NAD(P)/FAD-dependent oxidoreductase n=1 Tax=Aestuariimicrobium ganziense TaxID=2773677 RepID=UPI0019406633|nr:NAD(P)/FAD-dependent oxidoreductase [Aestuariimicrobium ganziense]
MPLRDQHVVIVGGGFAGLSAATALAKAGLRVTLVDRHPYSVFQPLLYQVATGGLNPGDITYGLRRFAANHRLGAITFRRGSVTGIDTEARAVRVSHGAPITYDHLVLAPGVGPNHFGIPGAAQHSRSIYTRGAALDVRDRIFSGLEALSAQHDPDRRFTVAVVGGGATGVEMAGTLAELKSEGLPAVYPEIATDNFRVVLVEMGDAVLAPFEPELRDYTLAQLRRRGVDVRLGTTIDRVEQDRLHFADGGSLEVDVVIWAAGVGAHPVVADWGLPQGRGGRILVDRRLRVQGLSDVYAVGDAALVVDDPLPQLAQPAIQMGRHAADQIVAAVKGRSGTDFGYVDKGTMATIGRNAAVVELALPGGRSASVTGVIAWLLWVVVHLRSLLGGRNRLTAMINMGVRYLTWPKSANGIIGDIVDPGTPGAVHDDD